MVMEISVRIHFNSIILVGGKTTENLNEREENKFLLLILEIVDHSRIMSWKKVPKLFRCFYSGRVWMVGNIEESVYQGTGTGRVPRGLAAVLVLFVDTFVLLCVSVCLRSHLGEQWILVEFSWSHLQQDHMDENKLRQWWGFLSGNLMAVWNVDSLIENTQHLSECKGGREI